MKSGQSIEYKKKIFYFKNLAENKARRIVSELLFFKKALYEVKASGLKLSFNLFYKP